MDKTLHRKTLWLGSSRKDVQKFPKPVRMAVGTALFAAERGETASTAVPMVGFRGAKVFEIIAPHDGDTYRAVYTVQFKEAIYVLHAFQKKSKRGIRTPLSDVECIKKRLKVAQRHHADTFRTETERTKK